MWRPVCRKNIFYMKIVDLSKQNTILNRFLTEIRDKEIQKDQMRFRRNIERIGEIMAYEISKELPYNELKVKTQLGEAVHNVPTDKVVLATILRAGLPLHTGFHNYFDSAENAFVSAYREYTDDTHFEVKVACHAFQGMLVDLITAGGKGAIHVGVEIGVAHGDVENFYAIGMQLLHQPGRFRQIHFRAPAFLHAEAVGVRETVIHVHTGGHDEVAAAALDSALDTFPEEPGAVFQASAVLAGPLKSAEELAV